MKRTSRHPQIVRALGVGAVCAATWAVPQLGIPWLPSSLAAEPAVISDVEGPVLVSPRVAVNPTKPVDAERIDLSTDSDSGAFVAPSTEDAMAEDAGAIPPAVEEAASPETTSDVALSPELALLRDRMRACAEYYSQRPENASERDPWSVMHALIAYGADTELIVGSQRVNAIGWMLWNGKCRGQQLLYLDKGRLAAHVGKQGTQGHAGQFLAMLAQWRVSPEASMKVGGRDFTVADFIEYEKRTCEPKTELTFKLIALSYYLESDETWKDEKGRTWSIPRLIQEELAQPIIGAACGGTHRLTGHAYAIRMRQRDGKPLDGQWERAKAFLDDYHEYAFSLQNADGSMSCNWFRGRGDWGDAERRVETTGHTFEWLAYSLPEEQLFDPRMVRMATFLTNTLIQNRKLAWEIGPKGHAIHGLNIYLDRAFDTKAEYITPQVARKRAEAQR